MTARNDIEIAERELFSALLTPHRSLNRTGFLVLMGFLTVISFAAGVVFTLMGAWPVFGFFGLDVVVVYWAFRVNFHRAQAIEEITITPSELRVRRVSHRGHAVEWVLNPLWVRLDQKTHAEFGIEKLVSGLARPPSLGRELSWSGRKSKLCQSFNRRSASRQAWPDLQSDHMIRCRESGGLDAAVVLHQNHDEPRNE